MSDDVTAALAEHAHGEDLARPVDSGHAGAVVARRADRSRDVRAVERAVRGRTSLEIAAGGFGRRDPVAGVGRVPVAARACARNRAARRILVVGDHRVDDHVVAGEIASDEIRVREDAGVDDADDDAARSGRQVPRRRQVHASRFRGGALEVPLVRAVVSVVRNERGLPQEVRLGVVDRGVGLQELRERVRLAGRQTLEQPNDECTARHRMVVGDRLPRQRGQSGDQSRGQRPVRLGVARDGGVLVLDDQPAHQRTLRSRGRRLGLRGACRGRGRGLDRRVQHVGQHADTIDQRARLVERLRIRQLEAKGAITRASGLDERHLQRVVELAADAVGERRCGIGRDAALELDRESGDGPRVVGLRGRRGWRRILREARGRTAARSARICVGCRCLLPRMNLRLRPGGPAACILSLMRSRLHAGQAAWIPKILSP